MASHYSAPKVGDIVQCRFPQDRIREPGPKERPALVLEVEEFELPEGPTEVFVTVAYGTSEDVNNRHPGEFTVSRTDSHAGLAFDTKFDLGTRVRLPFDDEWFGPAPGRGSGGHPKRGSLNVADLTLKRRLSAAVAELKTAKRSQTEDMVAGKAGRKKAKP